MPTRIFGSGVIGGAELREPRDASPAKLSPCDPGPWLVSGVARTWFLSRPRPRDKRYHTRAADRSATAPLIYSGSGFRPRRVSPLYAMRISASPSFAAVGIAGAARKVAAGQVDLDAVAGV